MGLPNVSIVLGNGNLGRVALTDDGVAGLILTGAAVAGKLDLNKGYVLASVGDLVTLGISEANNPLASKEVNAFYATAGEGSELHLLIVSEATTLTQICDPAPDSPLCKLINSAGGRIRIVAVNRKPVDSYAPVTTAQIDSDVVTAIEKASQCAESFTGVIWPFRVLLPAIAWTGETEELLTPREASFNRVGLILASDTKFGGKPSAAMGQVLGRAAKLGVHQNIGRVKDGAIATAGYLMNGEKPEESSAKWDILHDAGYIFYRAYSGKSGYYLNDDPMCAPLSDDYSNLALGRVIDKAIMIAYATYLDELLDTIEVDGNGKINTGVVKDFEASVIRAVNTRMAGEISGFSAYINPVQNVITTGTLVVSCEIVPLGTLRKIVVNMAFGNPSGQ